MSRGRLFCGGLSVGWSVCLGRVPVRAVVRFGVGSRVMGLWRACLSALEFPGWPGFGEGIWVSGGRGGSMSISSGSGGWTGLMFLVWPGWGEGRCSFGGEVRSITPVSGAWVGGISPYCGITLLTGVLLMMRGVSKSNGMSGSAGTGAVLG